MSESKAFLTAYPALRRLPEGDGYPVLALPGLAASDISTRPPSLLKELGCSARDRKLGPNRGLQACPLHVAHVLRDSAPVVVCGTRRGTLPGVRSAFVETYSEARGTDQNEASAWANEMQREHGRNVADDFA